MKDRFLSGLVCGAQWKSRDACLRDYQQPCPEGWQDVETRSVRLVRIFSTTHDNPKHVR